MGISDVAYCLLSESREVIIHEQGVTIEPVLLQPSEFLTVRTVSENTLHIGAYGHIDNLMSLVYERIAALEG